MTTSRGLLLGVIDGVAYDRLAERGHRRDFERGAVLMRQGDIADHMYVIVRGRVRVERAHPATPRPLCLAELGAGDVVGEMGIVLDAPRSATARALTDVVAIEVSRDATLRAFIDIPGLPTVLRRLIEQRLAQNDVVVTERIARYVARAVEGTAA